MWIIPTTVTADDLETHLRLLKQYIDDPPSFEDGKSGADLLRRKVVRKEYSDSDDSLSDSNVSESSGKPRKPTKKRKRRVVDDEELNARNEKRRLADLEKRAMIKSAMSIVDSDDEDDFVPYPMKEESDEDEDDVESLPQTKKKKILTPVYLFCHICCLNLLHIDI